MARQFDISGRTDRRIDALLTLLASRPMLAISGRQIAREIGVSGQTVWEWVERLRSLGVRVKGQLGAGYRVEHVPDVLVPGLLKPRLRRTIFQNHLHHFFKVASTNDVALQLGQAGAPHGTVVIAEEQRRARARRAGGSWHSEKAKGIYASMILRPELPPTAASVLTLVAGLAGREAVLEQTGYEPDIRWPNDLLIGGRKLCGILTEMHAEPDRIHFVVIGMGVNVNNEVFPGELAELATSLRIETGRTHSRLELLVKLLRQLEGHYNRFMAEGPEPILKRFSQVSSYACGKHVRICTAAETYSGVTDGLAPGGWLRVLREGGRVEIVVSGEVKEAS